MIDWVELFSILTLQRGNEGKHNLVAGIAGGAVVITIQYVLKDDKIRKRIVGFELPIILIILYLIMLYIIHIFPLTEKKLPIFVGTLIFLFGVIVYRVLSKTKK